jgi:hypothetical protein
MRPLRLVFVAVTLAAAVSAQSLRIDERASKIVLHGSTYDVGLPATFADTVPSANVKLEILAVDGTRIASSSSSAQLKIGANRLSASVTLPQFPKNSADLLWYRLSYTITANATELAHGVLPLFESVQDFSLHVSAPALVQPGKKFFVRVHTNHPVLDRPVAGVALTAQVRNSDSEPPLTSATGTTDASGYAVLSLSLGGDAQNHDLQLAVQAQRGNTRRLPKTT